MVLGDERKAHTVVGCVSHNCLLKLGLEILLERHPLIQFIEHGGLGHTPP